MNYRGFIVRYIGPSNTRGSRISIHDTRHNVRRVINYSHEISGHYDDQAKDWLEGQGIPICGQVLTDALPSTILLSTNFNVRM